MITEMFKNRTTRIKMSKGNTIMVTSMIHPEGDLVSNLSASMNLISVLLEPKATTLIIATAKLIKVNTYMHGKNHKHFTQTLLLIYCYCLLPR